MDILKTIGVDVMFGGVYALKDISIRVSEGSILGIIGPNGAGKTTLLNVISGFIKPRKGVVLYNGQDITKIKPYIRAKMGLGRTFQKTSEVFRHMTVLEAVMTGVIAAVRDNVFLDLLPAMAWHGPYFNKKELQFREIAEDIIEFMELYEYRHRLVGTLPYGLQKKVDIARALAGRPKVLLLDEPMSGLAREEREDVARYIIELNKAMKMTIVLVEHDLSLIYDIADVVIVMSYGVKLAEGPPAEILKSELVTRAYIGATV